MKNLQKPLSYINPGLTQRPDVIRTRLSFQCPWRKSHWVTRGGEWSFDRGGFNSDFVNCKKGYLKQQTEQNVFKMAHVKNTRSKGTVEPDQYGHRLNVKDLLDYGRKASEEKSQNFHGNIHADSLTPPDTVKSSK